MNNVTARKFWKRYLRLVCGGSASTYVINPAVDFTVRAKAGEYDSLSDKAYEERLRDCEQISALWQKKQQCTAGTILLEALQKTSISTTSMERIVQILAESPMASTDTQAAASGTTAPSPGAPHNTSNPPDMENLAAMDGWSPRSIYDYLCRRIQGQEEAKKAAAMITYNHVEGRRSNSVFCGPSGCGKSEIWRHLAKDYPKIIRILDASRLTADGWKGSLHLRDIFEGIPAEDIISRGLIVVLDEADKICCESAIGSGGTNYNALVQNSLLKMMDGDTIEFGNEDSKPAFRVDCSRVSVVLLGAFEHLLQNKSSNAGGSGIGFGASPRVECDYTNTEISYEDLIASGMRREIAGRINRIVPLHPLTVSDYKALLTGPIIDDLQAAGRYKIEIDNRFVDILSEQASQKELGARWMRSQVMNVLDDLMFDDPSADVYTVSVPAAD